MHPVDGLPRGRQQGFDTGQNGIGAFKKSIQSGIHVFSSGTFHSNDGDTATYINRPPQTGAVREHRYPCMIDYA
jgi:hypothetical protein